MNRCILFISFFNCLLLGCTPVGVATTSAQAIYDHHNLNKKISDNYLTIRAYQKLYNETDRFQRANISVSTFNQEVLLTGEVPDADRRREAEDIIRKMVGVNKVYNFITLSTPSSSLTRVSDAWITAKIKSKLLSMQDIDPSQIKVVTENGNVYLMGTIFHNQADIAVDIAQTTDGVQNIVKLFYYLYISKT